MSSFKSNKKRCIRKEPAIFRSGRLDADAVFLILDKLLEPLDRVSFGAVCREWRSLSKAYNHTTQRRRKVLPMLLMPKGCSDNNTKPRLTNWRTVYSVSEGKIYNNVELHVPFSKRCCGSSHGWLATVDNSDRRRPIVLLTSPFKKRRHIPLPPLICSRLILSGDPDLNPDNYMVAALFGSLSNLAFIKARQSSWSFIDSLSFLSDLIFYKSRVHAVTSSGSLVSLDVSSNNNPSLSPELAPPVMFPHFAFRYLVESTEGDLLQICRLYSFGMSQTTGFAVYKCEFSDRNGPMGRWVEVKSIGDEAFFVGNNHSLSVLASNFPGCRRNSIYYTHHNVSSCDMGIFNLDDGDITHFRFRTNGQKAVWVVPPFEGLG